MQELAAERRAAKAAVERLQLSPVLFELGARPHPPRDLYRAYFIELMRAELGDGQFLEVWSEGRSLPLEQALAYALEAPSQGSTLDMSELPAQNAQRR